LLTRDALTAGDVTFTAKTADGETFTFRVTVPADWIDLYPLYFIGIVPAGGWVRIPRVIHPDGQFRRTAASAFVESSHESAVARRALLKAWLEAGNHTPPTPSGS
jgi:hypothetical protein